MANKNFNWDAVTYFRELTETNKLAHQHGFKFCVVSSLSGFEEALMNIQDTTAFVCVSDLSDGWTNIDNTPHTRRMKTVFLAMRHAAEDMTARAHCMEILRELFRQFMTHFIKEKTRLENGFIYPDPKISFKEIERYFFSGCACAYFQIAIDTYTNLEFDENEWN